MTSSASPPLSPRRPAVAFGLGLLAPGLGLLYVGRAPLAFGAVAVWFAGSALAQIAAMALAPELLPASRVLCSLAVLIGAGLWATLLARRPAPAKGYQHWWWLFGFGFLTWAATMQVQTRLVAPRIGFAVRAPDDAMAPAITRGQVVVVDPNGAPRAEDVVLLRVAGGAAPFSLARVIAVPGQSVRVEANRATVSEAAAPAEAANSTVGVACDAPITSVAAGQLFVLPDSRTAESCAALPRLVPTDDLLGVVVRPIAKRTGG